VLRAQIVMRSVEFEIDCTVINGLVSEVVEVRWGEEWNVDISESCPA